MRKNHDDQETGFGANEIIRCSRNSSQPVLAPRYTKRFMALSVDISLCIFTVWLAFILIGRICQPYIRNTMGFGATIGFIHIGGNYFQSSLFQRIVPFFDILGGLQ